MKLFSNHLMRQIKREAIRNQLLPHLIGPACTFGMTVVIEGLSFFPWYTPSLALAFVGLAISSIYGGLRSSLLSAAIITAYGIVELDFDPVRISQVAISACSIAIVSGVGRRLLRQWVIEAELNKRKIELVDSLNGNLRKMLEALQTLDKLRVGWSDYTDAKRFKMVERAIGTLSNLLTMMKSWQEIAETKEKAIDYLNEMGGYPYRVDDAIKNIQTNQREMLKMIMHLSSTLQQGKGEGE